MEARTWPVRPGVHLNFIVDDCGDTAVLHTGTGDPHTDAMRCKTHASAQGASPTLSSPPAVAQAGRRPCGHTAGQIASYRR